MTPLVRADVVGSAHAYAALARIAEDERTRDVARTRCDRTAKDPALCTRGFIASNERRDRWGARVLAALLAISAGLVVTAVVMALVRVRRRARRMATFAMIGT